MVFNEEFPHFIQEHPNVLILFELLDSYKMSDFDDLKQQKKLSHIGEETSTSWRRIAWAFLKVSYYFMSNEQNILINNFFLL